MSDSSAKTRRQHDGMRRTAPITKDKRSLNGVSVTDYIQGRMKDMGVTYKAKEALPRGEKEKKILKKNFKNIKTLSSSNKTLARGGGMKKCLLSG